MEVKIKYEGPVGDDDDDVTSLHVLYNLYIYAYQGHDKVW